MFGLHDGRGDWRKPYQTKYVGTGICSSSVQLAIVLLRPGEGTMLEAMAEPSPEGELSTGTERGDGGGREKNQLINLEVEPRIPARERRERVGGLPLEVGERRV